MGETDLCVLVKEVEVCTACVCKFFAVVDRLTASADASSRTGHNFHKVVVYFPMFNCFKQFAYISKTTDNSSADRSITDLDFSFYNTRLKGWTADDLKCIRIRVTSCYKIVCGTKCSFHNTAGSTEDNTGTGPLFHKRITFAVFQDLWINMCSTDHSCQLSCSENCVNVMSGILAVEKFHVAFTFFRYARHDRYGVNVFRSDTDGLCKISLHNSTEHLLW